MIIGITGGSGCGKSAVAEIFGHFGAEIIDADAQAREVTKVGSKALCEIAAEFGEEYLNENGELLRKKLGSLVFSDGEKLEKLNEIINRYIRVSIAEKIKNSSADILVLDAPLLIEYGMEKMCDCVIAVLADRQVRLKRITERDLISELDAENRINSQKNDEYYLEKSDYIVYNNSTREDIQRQVEEIIDKIKVKL